MADEPTGEELQLLDVEQIDTVGFVPAGANPGADILLFKMKKDDDPMSDDVQADGRMKRFVSALAKGLGLSDETEAGILKEVQMADDAPTVEGLQAQLDELRKEHDQRATELTEAKEALAKAEAAPPAPPEDDTKLEKSLEEADPVIKQHLETMQAMATKAEEVAKAAEAEIQKLRDERDTERYTAIAKSVEIADVEDTVGFVRDLYKSLGDERADRYVETLRKSNALADQAGVFGEWGTDAAPAETGQALSTLEKMAANLAEEDGISVPQAFEKVLNNPNNRALYDQYVRERN